MRFDIGLIRGSLLIDLFSHSIVALTSPEAGPASGQALFVGATGLNSFGAGLIPAVNSLALCIMQSRGVTDTGKMFGAFSVLQATGQMIVGVRSAPQLPLRTATDITLTSACDLRSHLQWHRRDVPEDDLRLRREHDLRRACYPLPAPSRSNAEVTSEGQARWRRTRGA